MEIGPPEKDPQQLHSNISYKPILDHDHTLACVRADVYELSSSTKNSPGQWELKCSSEPVSLCYDSFRFMYRALCLKGTEIIVNSCIMPDSKISKTAPLFCTWNDDRTKKFLGFGFKQEVLIDSFMKAFEEAKKNMEELLSHAVPVNNNNNKQYSETWQPILLNYNVAVPSQLSQPPQTDNTVLPPSEDSRKASTAKSINTSLSKRSATSRKVTANSSTEPKRINPSAGFDMKKGLAPENERRSQPRKQSSTDLESSTLLKESIQFKKLLTTNVTKINEIKTELESLNRNNNIMKKSNEVLASNTSSLQMKCDEIEKKRKHWKELAENSERQQREKIKESENKRKAQLAIILEQTDSIKNRNEHQQTAIKELQSQEEFLVAALQDLHLENKAVSVTERKMHEDRVVIKKFTDEQLQDTVALKNKIEITLQSLLETSVDIKNSIQKTSFIIEHNINQK